MEIPEEIQCAQSWRNYFNTQVGDLHKYWLEKLSDQRHEQLGLGEKNHWRDSSAGRRNDKSIKWPAARASLVWRKTNHCRGLSRRLNRRVGSGSSKLGLVLEKKTLKGLSARIRFDKTKLSGRHEQAWFGRGERIRTSDPCVPNAVRYRAALRPDKNSQNRKASRDCLTSGGRNASHGHRPLLDR